MLVLSRKLDQAIEIQDDIIIKVLEISGDRVKLGISAPREVIILRQELKEEIRAENVTAATAKTGARSKPVIASLKEALANRSKPQR